MKTQDKQILVKLQAFNTHDILKAFKLFRVGLEDNNKKIKQELKADGWFPQKIKPEGRESYFFGNEYWVQTQEMREKQIKEQIEKMRQQKGRTAQNKKYTGQKMDLFKVRIKCPECNAGLYKQSVCGGCTEGKKGYKIRLICEENPDHEVLL